MQSERRKIKVLHVDDEPDFLLVTKYNLEEKYADFSVDTATSAEEGITLLKSGNYDVVVSDYQMLGMDGLEFLQNLRASADKIPFIMFTGRGREEIAIEALNKGANHYLQKEGDLSSLYQTLAHVISELAERKRAEEKVIALEKEHQLILDALPLNVFHINRNYEFVHVNEVLAERYGLEPKDFKGKTSGDLFPDVGEAYLESDKAVFESGAQEIGTIRKIVTPQGEKWVRLDKVPLKDADGTVTGLIGFELDITAQKKAEEGLRESEDKYRNLVERANDGICILQDAVVKYTNSRLVEWSGYTEAEIIGAPLTTFVASEEIPKVVDYYKRRVAGEAVPSLYETVLQKKNGEKMDAELNAGMIMYHGKPANLVLVRDIRERKRAEDAFRASEEKYRALVENANEVIVVAQDGVLKFVNPKAVEITGYAADELQNKTFAELIHPDDRAMVVERHLQRLKGEAIPAIYPFRIVTKGGETKWVESNAVLITWEGRPATLNFIGDITERKWMEEEIRQSEVLYRTVFEATSAPTVIVEEDTTLVLVNEEFAKLAGYPKEELEGKKSWTEFVVKEDLDRMKKYHYARREDASSAPGHYEFRFLNRYGKVQGIYLTIAMIPGTKRSVASFMVITERKHAEEALQESEREHQTVLDTVPVGIYHIDADGRFVHVNKALAERYGLTPADFKGKTSGDLFPDVGEAYLESDKEVLESGVPQSGVVQKLTTSEGVKWVRLDKVPLTDAAGNITDIVGFELDITERIRAQEELRDAHKQLQDIIEFLPDPTFVIDREKKVIAWNRAIEEMTGIQKDDILGKSDYEYALPFYGERRPILTDLVFSSDEEIESRYAHIGKTGNTLFAEVYSPFMYQGRGAYLWGIATPLFDRKGDVVGAIESIRDITDRKQAEKERDGLLKELEAKNREMEHFAYTVSHDLRSPLITIQGFTSMLQKDLEQDEREKAESDLKYVENAVTKMGELLSDTLELSRIGRFVNPPEDVPFKEIVSDALEQTAGEIRAKDIEVSVAEGFPSVHVDRMRIVEMLVNLITNSIKYRGDQPHPKIEIGSRVDGKDTVFFVKDNGIGIEKSQQKRVFELFHQVDKNEEGTGAGLAIVKRIIEVHEGRIWIESEKGKGCTVCFTLPMSP